MNPNTMIERTAELPFQKVVDETIIVNTKSRLMHSLNDLGGFIWQKLSTPVKLNELINEVVAEYEVEKPQAEKDVIKFLEEMEKQKLIKVVNK